MEEIMSISTTQKKHLNNMNRAAQDVQLGTILAALPAALSTGSYAVQSADLLGASTIKLTGFTGMVGFILQNRRSGSQVTTEIDATISGSSVVVKSGSSLVTTSASNTLAAGDALYWMGF
jgi:hypothetical protein